MTSSPSEKIVLSYLGERHYHRGSEGDDLRPACRPERIRGIPSMRIHAEHRDGLSPCERCWPESAPGDSSD